MDSWYLAAMRRIPGFQNIKNISPKPVRHFLRNRMILQNEYKPKWSYKSIDYIYKAGIIDDAKAILKYSGKPDSYWNFPTE